MKAAPSRARAEVSRRPAAALRVDRARLARASSDARMDNGWLIFHCQETAPRAADRNFKSSEGVAMRRRLNAFFAIYVNSPSVSMVNFSCCVGSVPKGRALGVTRRVTPQPMRAAVRMEAGAHA